MFLIDMKFLSKLLEMLLWKFIISRSSSSQTYMKYIYSIPYTKHLGKNDKTQLTSALTIDWFDPSNAKRANTSTAWALGPGMRFLGQLSRWRFLAFLRWTGYKMKLVRGSRPFPVKRPPTRGHLKSREIRQQPWRVFNTLSASKFGVCRELRRGPFFWIDRAFLPMRFLYRVGSPRGKRVRKTRFWMWDQASSWRALDFYVECPSPLTPKTWMWDQAP